MNNIGCARIFAACSSYPFPLSKMPFSFVFRVPFRLWKVLPEENPMYAALLQRCAKMCVHFFCSYACLCFSLSFSCFFFSLPSSFCCCLAYALRSSFSISFVVLLRFTFLMFYETQKWEIVLLNLQLVELTDLCFHFCRNFFVMCNVINLPYMCSSVFES